MSTRRRQKHSRGSRPPAARRGWWVFALAAIAVIGVAVLRWPASDPPQGATAGVPADTQAAAAGGRATGSTPELQALTGRWRREDGGYVLDVAGVRAGGDADVAYFNPRPIHVATARATVDGGTATLFVELRDVNYPGSTYSLKYDPATDRLAGVYYQAVQRQSFDVVFTRWSR